MPESPISNAPERAESLEAVTKNQQEHKSEVSQELNTTQDDAPPLPNEPVPDNSSEESNDVETKQDDAAKLETEKAAKPETEGSAKPETEATHTEEAEADPANPPLPDEEVPPLPNEPLPESTTAAAAAPDEPAPEDDGWDFRWDYATNRYIFFNRFTGVEQLENPRLAPAETSASASATAVAASDASTAAPPVPEVLGYNPAIHGDYDPNAWYAKMHEPEAVGAQPEMPDLDAIYNVQQAAFNRFTGHFQTPGEGSEKHSGDAKAHRQLNSYFDVDAAANAHNGRSLKAERQGKKLSKSELKQFKEKRKARKEVKRRAWLMD
ncbi:hypothetical protein TD95_002437 [Thielaviopsis punctulata]|uniref:WW domain-containing protein n=1 Tax=Thielaviopsis punctulata TaxID=72032 RepID=A0A0F4ZAI4_9PEZI|nr:hypothetical protein TD95_002437 [Thielaviopsis punctulata]